MKRFLIIYTAVLAVLYHAVAFISADYYWYELMYNGIGGDIGARVLTLCGILIAFLISKLIDLEVERSSHR